MNDLLLFLVGTVVCLMIASAVGLLLWGAAQEPRPEETQRSVAAARTRPRPATRRPLGQRPELARQGGLRGRIRLPETARRLDTSNRFDAWDRSI